MFPSSSLPQEPLLLRLCFRIARFLQRKETFGFDGIARLLLLGTHDMGLLERGLYEAVTKSVIV